ncbi:MAG: SpoIID/LytB domain-containing protein [Acidimicrobiales bacterium]
MRGGSRAGLVLAGVALVALGVAPPVAASGKEAAAPPRGWVVDRVRFESADPAVGSLSVSGNGEVRGAVELSPGPGGLSVVNDVGFEEYLQGVAEVPASWPMEALRAQAIAARTFAVHQLRREGPTEARSAGADICDTQACQVYLGLAKERSEHGSRWVEAVRSTGGQVLLYRGEPILAMYSSSNGGRSVAGSRPYLRSAPDPDSAKGPYNHWRVTLGYEQLRSAFGLPGPLTSLRRTGDAIALDWPGGQTLVPVLDFRGRLNESVPAPEGMPRTVPSTQFSVLADDPAAVATLDGRGHGHGIGLSQFGALGKASRGLRAGEILASYYNGIRPTTLPAEQLPQRIRVLLDSRGSATVSGSDRFRVLDGSGLQVAVAASGTWRVVAAGRGKVRVVPPVDQEAAATVEPLGAEPPEDGSRGQARFALSAAAAVRVKVEGPRLSTPLETPAALVEPGDRAAAALPALPGPGRYTVTVVADVGAGRSTAATMPLLVRRGATSLVAGVGAAPALTGPVAVAWGLLMVLSGLLWRTARRRRSGAGRPG